MMRSRNGRRRLGPSTLALIICMTGAIVAVGLIGRVLAGDGFHPQTTLGSSVAPQDLSLDATISSMVRRGLLPEASPPAMQRRPAVSTTPARAAQSTVSPKATGRAQDGWRARGTSPNRHHAARPTQTPRVANSGRQRTELRQPATNRMYQQPATNSARERHNAPRTPMAASLPPARPLPGAKRTSPPVGASRPPAAEAVDSAEEDDLAPIDDLPEMPAPDTDLPGDSREPENGDEGFTGDNDQRAREPNARGGASIGARQSAPAGEPDRIERRDPNSPPPEDPRNYSEEPVEEPKPATKARRPLTRNELMLRDKVRRVLKHYYDNPLNTGDRSPWEVMHQMLAFEVHSRIRQEGPHGAPITAVGWLCFNQPCKGRTLLYLNEDGDLRVKVGPALQGHHGQLLALLAQARVRPDYPMLVEGKKFTVADLIEMEKATTYPRTELTFKLLGLNRYLEPDARWVNDQGVAIDFPMVMRDEMRQGVRTAACGGTHRLSGLILTVKKRQRAGLPIDGAYAEAARFVANYQNYAYRLQNPDGSFSTEWLKGPGAEEDIDRRLKTTGHTLEFLIYAADDEQLAYYRTVRAVNYLANIMWANRDRDWEAGPLGHAIHALVLYDRFVFAPHDHPTAPVATNPGRTKR